MPNIIRIGGGGNWTPSIFGDGSDGDLVVTGTTSLPVTVPHQSIVEKQYKSLTINAGAILKCASWNAGLILRVKGDCTIHGTIDQSGKAPKTNPGNNYPYPSQLVCGDGGNGGSGSEQNSNIDTGYGGTGMLRRSYGGGYGGGGGGGGSHYDDSYLLSGGNGGDSSGITTSIDTIFVGGAYDYYTSNPGRYGGGGSSGRGGSAGGTGAGASGTAGNNNGGGSGGAGNYGGGIVLLYVGGALNIDGFIRCNGLQGGSGGASGEDTGKGSSGGGGGGGAGGGGAIYICYKDDYANTGLLQVNGGKASAGGSSDTGANGGIGSSGGVGSITVVQWTKDMGV